MLDTIIDKHYLKYFLFLLELRVRVIYALPQAQCRFWGYGEFYGLSFRL